MKPVPVPQGKPSWRTMPPDERARIEVMIADGCLTAAQKAAFDRGYDFDVRDVRENFQSATKQLAGLDDRTDLPAWKKHQLHGPLLAASVEEARMLRFSEREDVVKWRSEPRIAPEEAARLAAQAEREERDAFIARRSAEIIEEENQARQARARSQAELEFQRAKGFIV